ncbi:hypothetical protein ACFQYP_08390 [Nonomuraea antimicrobica]
MRSTSSSVSPAPGERAADVAALAPADADGLFEQLVDLAGVERAVEDDVAVAVERGLLVGVRHGPIITVAARSCHGPSTHGDGEFCHLLTRPETSN